MRFVVVALLAALFAVAVLAAPAALAGNKTGQTCYKRQYVNYIDPSTGQPFATEEACTSSLAQSGVVYPLSTAICFDSSWSLIKDQNNGADGSATSGRACGDFLLGGGSLAGLQLTTSGTSISFSYTINVFAVNFVTSRSSSAWCSLVNGRPVCGRAGSVGSHSIGPPYTFAESSSLDCTLSGALISREAARGWTFTTLGGHSLSAGVSCTSGPQP